MRKLDSTHADSTTFTPHFTVHSGDSLLLERAGRASASSTPHLHTPMAAVGMAAPATRTLLCKHTLTAEESYAPSPSLAEPGMSCAVHPRRGM